MSSSLTSFSKLGDVRLGGICLRRRLRIHLYALSLLTTTSPYTTLTPIQTLAECRIEHYQTLDKVFVSVYAKRTDKEKSTVTFEEDKVCHLPIPIPLQVQFQKCELMVSAGASRPILSRHKALHAHAAALRTCRPRRVHLCRDGHKSAFSLSLLCKDTLLLLIPLLTTSSQVDLNLKKKDNRSWAVLESKDAKAVGGFSLTFGVTGRTGTVGGKEKDLVLDAQNLKIS